MASVRVITLALAPPRPGEAGRPAGPTTLRFRGRAGRSRDVADALGFGAVGGAAALALLGDQFVGEELLDRQREVFRRVIAEGGGNVLHLRVGVLLEVGDDLLADLLDRRRGAAAALLDRCGGRQKTSLPA